MSLELKNIYGKDIHDLKGKTTRTKPKPVVINYLVMTKNILENNKNITLSIDIMFVNNFFSSRQLADILNSQLLKSFKNGQNHNCPNASKMSLQFTPRKKHALLDGEFVPLRTDLLNMGIYANFATRN